MNRDAALAFADRWVQDWNAHDVEALLGHFSDDVVFTSPYAAAVIAGSDGVVRGKPALRHYWTEGLRRLPALRFEVVDTYVGVDTVVINYRNHNNALVNEVLRFTDGLVVEGHGTYLNHTEANR